MKKILLGVIFLAIPVSAWAGNLNMTGSASSPWMSLFQFQLNPTVPTEPCIENTFRLNTNQEFVFCKDGLWVWPRDSWTQRTDSGTGIKYLHPTESVTTLRLGLGTGTTLPEFKLTLDDDAGILAKGTYGSGATLATAGAGTRLIWYPRKAAFRAGIVSATSWNDVNIGEYSVVFGSDNEAVGPGTAVLSGLGNKAGRNDLGELIRLLTAGSVVAGGAANQSKGIKTFVGAGHGNIAEGSWSAVGGGVQNRASGTLSFIGGGGDQTMATWNTASGSYSSILGGITNTASGHWSSIGGGSTNSTSGDLSTVGGGGTNTASGGQATIGGGFTNEATGTAATVAGGANNHAIGNTSSVGGGNNNWSNGANSTIAGGTNNITVGNISAILGGNANQAGADGSVIVGGVQNLTDADYSLVGGVNLTLDSAADRSFVWGYNDPMSPLITFSQPDSAMFYISGNFGIGQSAEARAPAQKLVVDGAGTFYGNLTAVGSVNSQAVVLAPQDNAPNGGVDGEMYYNSSGAWCVNIQGNWYDLLKGAAGGVCP